MQHERRRKTIVGALVPEKVAPELGPESRGDVYQMTGEEWEAWERRERGR